MREWLRKPVSFGIWLLTIVMVGVAVGLVMAFAINSAIAAHDAKTSATRQKEGRKVAVDVTCAAMSAVIDAGRATISGSGIGPKPIPANATPAQRRALVASNRRAKRFESNLVRLGYPPKLERQAAAKQAAVAYGRAISTAVQKQAGVRGIVRPNGTLRCDALRVAAKTG